MSASKKILLGVVTFISCLSAPLQAQEFQLDWVVSMGGTGSDWAFSIAVDGAGNVYTAGFFQNTVDLDPGVGESIHTSAGFVDIFVQKLDPDGNLLWVNAIGGTSLDDGRSITLDDAGNVYVTGRFSNTVDFDPGAGVFNLTDAGGQDIFILKLDTDGNFMWARAMGSTGLDVTEGIVLDDGNNVYTTGQFAGTVDFDPGAGVFNLTSAGSSDVFVQKLDNDGNFIWARTMGGTDLDAAQGISVDNAGNVYTTGLFNGIADFDPGPGVFILTSVGSFDAFLLKLDTNGGFLWAGAMGGPNFDFGSEITVDDAGNVYTTGRFSGTVDFDLGSNVFNITSAGSGDSFIQKLDTDGCFLWTAAIGGTGFVGGIDIKLDLAGDIYTTGTFSGTTDFDPGAGVFDLISAGGTDIFVLALDTDGNLRSVATMGGTGFNQGLALTVDSTGRVYVSGEFRSTVDFDPGPDMTNLTSVFGNSDAFVLRLSTPCPGDTDGDGSVGFTDLLTVIFNWGPCGTPCPADINGDGTVNFEDLIAVIINFGTTCN